MFVLLRGVRDEQRDRQRDRFGDLELRSERTGEQHVIALCGELDLAGADQVTEELLRVEATDACEIVVDLSELRFIDSSGIRLIVEADGRSRADGNRSRLIRGPALVRRVFEIRGVTDRLPFAG